MRFSSTFKLVAFLLVCCFMLSAIAASAAPGERARLRVPKSKLGVGPLSTAKAPAAPFMKTIPTGPTGSFTEAYCESGCCWASGEFVVCSESGCYAEGGGETAIYICEAQ
jgi:hypothetical protein